MEQATTISLKNTTSSLLSNTNTDWKMNSLLQLCKNYKHFKAYHMDKCKLKCFKMSIYIKINVFQSSSSSIMFLLICCEEAANYFVCNIPFFTGQLNALTISLKRIRTKCHPNLEFSGQMVGSGLFLNFKVLFVCCLYWPTHWDCLVFVFHTRRCWSRG